MTYSTHSRDYLYRAELLLKTGGSESLFYSAFELRCGVEGRLQEYLENWNHIPDKKKNNWEVAKLGKSIKEYLKLDEKICRLLIGNDFGEPLAVFFYTPVTKALKENAGRLGKYLHRPRDLPDDPWWDSFHSLIKETCFLLRVATTGTLLGPPLMQKGTSRVNIIAEVAAQSPLLDEISQGSRHRWNISYIDCLPEPLDPEAIVSH